MDDLIEKKEDEDNYCLGCNGNGEGQYDGARCWQCKGKGTIQHSEEYQDEN